MFKFRNTFHWSYTFRSTVTVWGALIGPSVAFSAICSSLSSKFIPCHGSKVKICTLSGRLLCNPEYCERICPIRYRSIYLQWWQILPVVYMSSCNHHNLNHWLEIQKSMQREVSFGLTLFLGQTEISLFAKEYYKKILLGMWYQGRSGKHGCSDAVFHEGPFLKLITKNFIFYGTDS